MQTGYFKVILIIFINRLKGTYTNVQTFLIANGNKHNTQFNIIADESNNINDVVTLLMSDSLTYNYYYDILIADNYLVANTYSPFTIIPANPFSNGLILSDLIIKNINIKLEISSVFPSFYNQYIFSTFVPLSNFIQYSSNMTILNTTNSLNYFEISNCNINGTILPPSTLYYVSSGTRIFNFDVNPFIASGFFNLITNITTINITNNNIQHIGSLFQSGILQKPVNNFIMKNNFMRFIPNGVLNLNVFGFFDISNNIISDTTFNINSKSVISLIGNYQGGNSILYNNIINIVNSISDTTLFSYVYRVKNFSGILTISIDQSTKNLYGGMDYDFINNTYTCDKIGQKNIKINNPGING